MGCILVLFLILWIINVKFAKFQIFNFFIFKYSDIGLLWSKITIFIIEKSLKLHYIQNTGWDNPNSHRLGLKSPKFHFLPFLGAQKFIAYTNIQIHVTCSIFIVNCFLFLEMLVSMSSIRSNNNWNYQKMIITASTVPLRGEYKFRNFFFIIHCLAIMHRTTIVQNGIIMIIWTCVFLVGLILIGLP